MDQFVICASTRDPNDTEVKVMFPMMLQHPLTSDITKAHAWPSRADAQTIVDCVALNKKPVALNDAFSKALDTLSVKLRKNVKEWADKINDGKLSYPIYLSVHRIELETVRKQDKVMIIGDLDEPTSN